MNLDYDYLLAPIMFHLEPMCAETTDPSCGDCSAIMELVPPERLFFGCRSCQPGDFLWIPYSEEQG